MEDFFRIGYSQTSHDIQIALKSYTFIKRKQQAQWQMSLTHIGKLKATSRKRQRQ